jgi:lipoate-protein ligase A
MINPDIRQQVHQLVDAASENQLDAIIELLQPASSRYTKDDIDSFYIRVQQLNENGNKGYSVEESHNLIRSKFKKHGS